MNFSHVLCVVYSLFLFVLVKFKDESSMHNRFITFQIRVFLKT